MKKMLELFGRIDEHASFKLLNLKEAVFEINKGARKKKLLVFFKAMTQSGRCHLII